MQTVPDTFWSYGALNRLQSVQMPGPHPVYSYDAVGNLSQGSVPGVMATSYNYDGLNRLTSMQTLCDANASGCTPGQALSSYSYTLGAAGNRLSVAELSGRTVAYTYDDLYRLTSETISNATTQNGTIGYQYDAVGNRKQLNSSVPAIPASGLLKYDADDRTSTDPYDANGNLLNSGAGANVYDFENRLIQAGNVQMVYDGDGNRVQETAGGTTTFYLISDLNPTGYAQVIQEQSVTGTFQKAYFWGLDLLRQDTLVLDVNPFGIVVGAHTDTSYYGHDGHGSVRYLTDGTGRITDTYDYDAFGNLVNSTGSTVNNYLFAGEQFDPALGIYYNRARYYDERSGRFWTVDTYEGIAFDPGSMHRYLYAGTNPVNQVDPSGNLVEEPLVAQTAGEKIDGESAAVSLRIFQTVFRTTLYASKELVSSTPTLLLKGLALLTALGVAAASIIDSFATQEGELPDAVAAHAEASQQNNETPLTLFRDTQGTSPSDFKWRGPTLDPDGLSFFETPFKSPVPKPFSVGFNTKYVGEHRDGACGGFVEPELFAIPTIYTPNIGGEGHWSVPVTDQAAKSYQDRFAAAAKRIKQEKTNFKTNPNM